MHIDDFFDYIVVPSLTVTGLYSPSSGNLVLGTAIIETNLDYLEQIGKGKAVSFYQIENKTYDDNCRYLNRYDNAKLKELLLSACFYVALPPFEALIHNMRWATLMCRIKYYMQPEPLPVANDIDGLGNYYKKYYNTPLGKASPSKIRTAFEYVVNRKPD